MALPTVLVDALHPALEHAEIALKRARVHLTYNVLFAAMAHDTVIGELLADMK
jgi:hypothetical protein